MKVRLYITQKEIDEDGYDCFICPIALSALIKI